MSKTRTISNVYVVAGLCTIGGRIQGFDVSSMSAIIGTKQYKHYFNNPGSTMQGGITASMAGGSLLGAISRRGLEIRLDAATHCLLLVSYGLSGRS